MLQLSAKRRFELVNRAQASGSEVVIEQSKKTIRPREQKKCEKTLQIGKKNIKKVIKI